MFSTADTIVAIATPPGRGGIGVVRISGPQARPIAERLVELRGPFAPRHATYARLTLIPADPGDAAVADAVVATFFPGPHSYTGDDVVEISAHGSPVVLDAIVRAAMRAGARLARAGEFTLRAFLHGRINLVQAEAVADLIEAATPVQARVAFDQLDGTLTARIADIDGRLFDLTARLEASLDFPDEGYHFVESNQLVDGVDAAIAAIDTLLADAGRGRAIREGATVVIAGRPNVGKSSLFNKLIGTDRSIVTEVPGTTRDMVTERLDIDGVSVTLVDTAGDRETHDRVEHEGVARAERARDVADLVVVVLDRSEPLTADDERLLESTRRHRRLVIANKSDRARSLAEGIATVDVSAETGGGLDEVRTTIVRALTSTERLRDTPAVSNVRHIGLMNDARRHLLNARDAAACATPEEFVIADLASARHCFDDIVGVRTSEDVLRHIFDRFCIGK
jgi:tRNA modification GTPase